MGVCRRMGKKYISITFEFMGIPNASISFESKYAQCILDIIATVAGNLRIKSGGILGANLSFLAASTALAAALTGRPNLSGHCQVRR